MRRTLLSARCTRRWTAGGSAGMRHLTASPINFARRSKSTDPTRWPSTFPGSCSPRTITSSTSSRRGCSAPTTSTPTRGCAWPRRSRATSRRSAPMRRPRATKTSRPPSASSSPAPIPRGRTRSCSSASRTAAPRHLIVVDPRRTETARAATLHLQIAPGSDVALFNGMLQVMLREGWCDLEYIRRHTENFERLDLDGRLGARSAAFRRRISSRRRGCSRLRARRFRSTARD